MRIAYYVPETDFLTHGVGGDRVMVRNLSDGLRARGHDVRVMSHVGSGEASLHRLLVEMLAVRRRTRDFRPDAWLVFSPNEQQPDVFGWWQRPRAYLIFGAHAPGSLRRRARDGLRPMLLSLAQRSSLRTATAVTTWRPAGLDKLRRYGLPEERLHLLLPAARSWPDLPSREEARQRLGLPAEATIVMSAGRLSMSRPGKAKYKKTDMMLELVHLVERLPEQVVLLVVGDNGAGLSRLQEAARTQPPGRVRVVVSEEHGAMKWWYAACDIYAYPHPKDTPWVSVLEAQLAGRPVVVRRTPSAELTVQDGTTGLLAGDLDEFGQCLRALAGDPQRRAELGQAGRDHVLREHTLERRVAQIEQLLLADLPGYAAQIPTTSFGAANASA